MTANMPLSARPLQVASSPSLAIGQALDRVAYGIVWVFVFVLPWGESLPVIGSSVLSTWVGLAAVGVGALRTLTLWRARKPSPLHHWMLALAGWSAFSILWTIDWGVTVTRAGTYLQLLVVVWLIWESAVTQSRVRRLLQAYVSGALLSSGMTIYNFVSGRTAAQLSAAVGRTEWETSRYTVYGLNANDLGLMLALSVPMVFYLLVSSEGRLMKLLCWLELVAGFTAILLTGSRGSLVAATAGLAMYPFIVSRLSRSQRLISAFAGVGLLACGIYFVPQSSWMRIFQFGSDLSEGTLTHRTLLWTAGLDSFRNHPFLGVGSGAYGITIQKAADWAYMTGSAANAVAHNTFLSVLVELGVVGAGLLLVLLASLLYCAVRMRYMERCLWVSMLLTWTIGVSALTWEYRKPTWLLFGLLAAHVYSRRQTERILHVS